MAESYQQIHFEVYRMHQLPSDAKEIARKELAERIHSVPKASAEKIDEILEDSLRALYTIDARRVPKEVLEFAHKWGSWRGEDAN